MSLIFLVIMHLSVLARRSLQLSREGQITEGQACSVTIARNLDIPWKNVTRSMGIQVSHRIEDEEAIIKHPTGRHTIPGLNRVHKIHKLLR